MKNLLYISILIFLFSCTKGGGNMYVEGRVYNPITGEGIEGANIILFRDKPFSGALGAQSGGSKTVESVFTDSDGHYEIKHAGIANYLAKMYKLGDYAAIGWVNIHSKNKTYNAKGANNFEVKLSKNMHADFQAVPYGYLKLSIHNINCQGEGDKIFYKRYWLDNNEVSNGVSQYDCFQYDGDDFKIPMGNYKYEWQVTKNGMLTNHDTTFFIPENGHYHLTINY